MNNYDLLLKKIDSFIRKYYANLLLKGILIFVACFLIYFLLISIGEYYLYFPVWLKLFLINFLFIAGIISLVFWIIIPLLKMQKLGKTISHQQASKIIGSHFPEVSDKLLNILQLKETTTNHESKELIEFAIAQKSAQLKAIPFVNAIDISKNRRFLPWVLPPILIILALLIASPNIFKESSHRLLQPATAFAPPPPFVFLIQNEDLTVPMYGSYELRVKVKGDKFPENVFLNVNNELLPMKKESNYLFSYHFARVVTPIVFRIEAGKVSSEKITLSILERPQLKSFNIQVQYPAHTGKKNEILTSLSDMVVPQGTTINWQLTTNYTDKVGFKLQNSKEIQDFDLIKNQGKEQKWQGKYQFMQDTAYTIVIYNNKVAQPDSFTYQIKTIPDMHPQIHVDVIKDTVSGTQILMAGTAGDDYGISRLYFHYSILDDNQQPIKKEQIPLTVQSQLLTRFEYYFDIGALRLEAGHQVNYYMEVWDNDAINGSKNSRTEVQVYSQFKTEELDSVMQKNAEQIQQGLNSSSSHSKQMQEEMKTMQEQLLQSQSMSWEQQQKIKSLAEKQLQLQSQVEAVKKRFEEQKKQSEQKKHSKDIEQKQEEISKQLEHVLNKELEEQKKKLQELMQKLSKENAFETLQKMENENKLFNMNMERIQELIKRLEMQMSMEDLANKLDKLAKEEGILKEKTAAQIQNNSDLKIQQEHLRKELEKSLSKEMKDIETKNQQLQQPQKGLDELKEMGQDATEQMKQSEQELGQNKNDNASQSQQKAQQKMKKMADKMRQMAGGMGMEQIEIDIKATRQILSNLIRYSFDQESLMQKVKQTPHSSPLYVANSKAQGDLRITARMIKDSLFVLSKRVFQIEASVNKETTNLELNLQKATEAIEARKIPQAVTNQQYAMSNANNLALILNELLENLMDSQAKMQGEGEGNEGEGENGEGQGGKSGGKGMGQQLKDIITGQQSLGQGMEKSQKGEGENGEGESGERGEGKGEGKGEGGEYGNAKELAEMAKQQAALRRQIQELSSELNSKGMGGNAQLLKELQELMDKNETDLVNKRLSAELIRRQKQILTKMLEAEKAIREQEEDEKRVGNSGKDEQRPIPPELQEFLRKRAQMTEAYRTAPPKLTPYFHQMNEKYIKQVR